MGNMFTKELFVQTIDALKKQYEHDITYSASISNLLQAEDVPVYNNSVLINQIFLLLQNQFPPSKDGQCEIERYCFELNFGFNGGGQVITPENLWDNLNNNIV